MSALHLPLGWHARGDHAEVELDDDADWEASVAAARAHNERGEG